MKQHTTNYTDTFITQAPDSPATAGMVPPHNPTKPTHASLQYQLLAENPYRYTSDDVFFHCYAQKQALSPGELAEARELFFSKGQPCFRASPLTRTYGWGVHSDSQGRVALYGCQTPEYQRLSTDPALKVVADMRSSR